MTVVNVEKLESDIVLQQYPKMNEKTCLYLLLQQVYKIIVQWFSILEKKYKARYFEICQLI